MMRRLAEGRGGGVASAPGSAAMVSDAAISMSMPRAIVQSGHASSPSGMAASVARAAGMMITDTSGIATRLPRSE